ncbi:uncharacterized protein TM35_000421230 [Trypanosoma theileri]|uniref:Uncharacterized protein n=1 Tax=Trypanosoma theileri TaxID=67003 RepID=A0A1X0NIV2_9TRYP|nr:uncharacterized protein TM35_000421230 [Trypanosoma theileri]ORC84665.1 hypothetical protein TM35_000421230 [Trypanosoma theileri]
MANKKLREVVRIMQEENERDRELVLALCRAEHQKLLEKQLAALVHLKEQQQHYRASYTASMKSVSSHTRQIPGQVKRSNSFSGGGTSSIVNKTPCVQRMNNSHKETLTEAEAEASVPVPTKTTRMNGVIPSYIDQMSSIRKGDPTNDNMAYGSSSSSGVYLDPWKIQVTGEQLESWQNVDSATTTTTATITQKVNPILSQLLPEWQRDVVTMTDEEVAKANLVDKIHRLYGDSTAVQGTLTPILQQQQHRQQQLHRRPSSTVMDPVAPERSSHFLSSVVKAGGTATATRTTTTTASSVGGGGGVVGTGRSVMSKEEVMSELRRLYGLEDSENGGNIDD